MNEESLVERALAFSIAHSVPVFPCRQDKSPACRHGHIDASSDPNVIRELFAHPEASLIGLPTGTVSGICVLDVDRAKEESVVDGFSWLEANSAELPQTRVVRTQNKGLHFYFASVDGLRGSVGKLHPHVDIRAEGNYVIAAGPGYALEVDIPLSSLPLFPAHLSDALVLPADKEEASPAPKHDLSQVFTESRWHDTMLQWTASVVQRGDSAKTIMDVAPLVTLEGWTVEKTREELEVMILGAIEKGYAPASSSLLREPFRLKTLDDLLALKDPEFLIDDLLLENSIAMVFGPTGSYKSTVVIDMCVCLQNGLPWQDKASHQCNVAIFSHEDGGGFKNRYLAAAAHHGIENPQVYWDGAVPNLMDKHSLNAYVDELREHEIKLIVIDTLAYAMAGGEENSAKEMGVAVDGMQKLRNEVGATILLIHHSGKDKSRGARGSSVLKAAVDTELELDANGDKISLHADKQRHIQPAKPDFLRAKTVPIGDRTACVIVKGSALAFKGNDLGVKGQSALAWGVIEVILREAGSLSVSKAAQVLRQNPGFTKRQNKPGSFEKALKRCLEDLCAKGLIEMDDETITLGLGIDVEIDEEWLASFGE